MKTKTAAVMLFICIVALCIGVVTMPISASCGFVGYLDAVAGSRGAYQALSAPLSGSTSEVFVSVSKGGTVSAGASSAAPGKTVSVSVSPNPGYEPASIFAISASGQELQISVLEGGYSFKMPPEAVMVDVTFQLKRLS